VQRLLPRGAVPRSGPAEDEAQEGAQAVIDEAKAFVVIVLGVVVLFALCAASIVADAIDRARE
jgi:hypothetical protein